MKKYRASPNRPGLKEERKLLPFPRERRIVERKLSHETVLRALAVEDPSHAKGDFMHNRKKKVYRASSFSGEALASRGCGEEKKKTTPFAASWKRGDRCDGERSWGSRS